LCGGFVGGWCWWRGLGFLVFFGMSLWVCLQPPVCFPLGVWWGLGFFVVFFFFLGLCGFVFGGWVFCGFCGWVFFSGFVFFFWCGWFLFLFFGCGGVVGFAVGLGFVFCGFSFFFFFFFFLVMDLLSVRPLRASYSKGPPRSVSFFSCGSSPLSEKM